MKILPKLSILVLLSLLFTVALRAQQAADVRVSPPDSDNYVMPPDAHIQASARIDTRALMVWGTTVNLAPDSIATALVARLIDKSGLLGTQLRLSSADARPYGFVQVIPMVDRFLVIWDDRRVGAGGLYARAVGIDGTILEDERRISAVAVAADSGAHVDVLGDVSRGVALCWKSSLQGGIYALRLDAQGRADGAEERLGKTLRQVLTYASLPGLYVVRVDSGAGRVIYGDGRIDARVIPAGRLPDQFWLNADTSLARIAGHDLEIYRSIYDATPARVIPVPALDSAYKGMAVVARDTGSGYVIYFPTVVVTGGVYSYGKRITTFYRIRIDDHDSVTAPLVHYVDNIENNALADHDVYAYGGAWTTPGCSGSARVTIWFVLISVYHGQAVYPTDSLLLEFSLGSDGAFEFGLSSNRPTVYLDNCTGRRPVTIVRTGFERTSSVRDSIGGIFHADSVATGFVGVNLPQTEPGLMLVDDTLLVVWRHAAHGFQLSTWPSLADTASRIDRFTTDTLPRYLNESLEHDPTYNSYPNDVVDTLATFDHGGVLSIYRGRHDYISFWVSPISQNDDEVTVTNTNLLLPRPTGWRMIRNNRSFTSYVEYMNNRGTILFIDPLAWDPNRRESLLRAHSPDLSVDSLIAVAPDGRLAWWTKSVQIGTAVIPVDSADYLTVSQDTLRHVRGSVATVSKITAGDPGALYRRLLGNRFLRCTQRGTGTVLEMWDLDGNAINTVTLTADSAAGAPAIVEDPRDSTLQVVTVHDGVRLAHLTKKLGVVYRDSLISVARSGISHPAGVVRKDTLLVVWEDRRHGQPDIYGSSFTLPAPLGSGDTVEQNPTDSSMGSTQPAIPSTSIDRVYPNPARGLLHVECRLAGSGTIEVVDPIGRVVRREMIGSASPGMRPIDLAVDDLIEGVYLLRLRSDAAVSTAGFVVMR